MMSTVKINGKVVGGVFLFLFSIFGILFLIFIIMMNFGGTSISKDNIEASNVSKYYLYNPVTNSSYFGFSQISRDENPAFISSKDHQYKCYGSCYCVGDTSNNQNQRRSASIQVSLVRGILLAIGSISTLIAYNQAQELLGDYCTNSYQLDSCSFGVVKAEIDDCSLNKEELGVWENVAEFENSFQDSLENREFSCTGKCLPLIFDDNDMAVLKLIGENEPDYKNIVEYKDLYNDMSSKLEEKQFKCDSIEVFEIVTTNLPSEEWLKKDGERATGKLLAEDIFMERFLDPLCGENSAYDIPSEYHSYFVGKIKFCRGFKYAPSPFPLNKNLGKHNPSVKCDENIE